MEEASALQAFIQRWLDNHTTTWEWLLHHSGLGGSTGTRISRGAIPQSATLRKLSEGMGIPRRVLFELAGYLGPDDLEPEEYSAEEAEIISIYRQIPLERRRLLREMLEVAARYDSDQE